MYSGQNCSGVWPSGQAAQIPYIWNQNLNRFVTRSSPRSHSVVFCYIVCLSHLFAMYSAGRAHCVDRATCGASDGGSPHNGNFCSVIYLYIIRRRICYFSL
jgi:hypothetical protein